MKRCSELLDLWTLSIVGDSKYYKAHNVSKTIYVSVLRWGPLERANLSYCTTHVVCQYVSMSWYRVEGEVTLRLTNSQSVSQSVSLGIERPCGTCDQILLPVGMSLSKICCHISVGRPLWRKNGSAICSVIIQWSESRRTRNHTLLSRLRLPQSGGTSSRIYIPQEQGDLVIPTGTGFPLRRILRLAGLRWRYSNPSPNLEGQVPV
jgi:hypothetical protein